jgi:MtN3 and saliva related transmembrane protein
MTLDLLGYTAAALTTSAFVPQALKTVLSRDTSGISLWMYLVFTTGVALWFVYGLAAGEWPIIVANAVTFPLAATVLVLKLRHG